MRELAAEPRYYVVATDGGYVVADRLTARYATPLSQPLREQRARDSAARMDAAWRRRLAAGDLDDATLKVLLRRAEAS